MSEQTNQESEKTYTLEEIAQKRADAISFYTNQIAVLTVQAEFEKLQAYWETNIKESSTFIAESSMGDVHIMAEEAKTFEEFRAEFVKEYGISKKENNKELVDWLKGIWKENH